MKKIILVGLMFGFLAACGIKGNPLPPLKEETIQAQKNWDEIEKSTQPAPPVPAPKKGQTKKKVTPNEN